MADAFDRLIPTIEAFLSHCYQEGYEKGRSLLAELSGGEITLDDLLSQDANIARNTQKLFSKLEDDDGKKRSTEED